MTSSNQGEGNREADRRYRESKKDFVDSGKVEQNADKHRNVPEDEKQELDRAREEARQRAKGFEPEDSDGDGTDKNS